MTRKIQHPVYFISSVLRDARERYPMMQKLLLAILIASRKMRPYFESHPITVVSKYPLRSPLENPLATGRVSWWAMYRRSVTGVLQSCIDSDKGKELLKDIHQGECGHHASARAIANKAFRHGHYWPTAMANAEELVLRCRGCQQIGRASCRERVLRLV